MSTEVENLKDSEYVHCCARFSGVKCIHLSEFYIQKLNLCRVHYYIYMLNIYKESLKWSLDTSIIDRNVGDVLNILKDNIGIDNPQTFKLKKIHNCFNIRMYKYESFIIKILDNTNMKMLMSLDVKLHKDIVDNISKAILKKYTTSKFKTITSEIKDKKNLNPYKQISIIIYKDIHHTFSEFIRYKTKDEINEIFIEIAKMIQKFHKKSIIIGDISSNSIAIYDDHPIIISYYSMTDGYDMYGDYDNNLKTNMLCCDILTGSVNSLEMNYTRKEDDVESLMWFYLQSTNNKYIKSLEKLVNSDESSIIDIIKFKKKFIKNTINQNNLLQINDNKVINVLDETIRFINYFS